MKIYSEKGILLIFICSASILVSCSNKSINNKNYKDENIDIIISSTNEYTQNTEEITIEETTIKETTIEETTTKEITEKILNDDMSEKLIKRCIDFLHKNEIDNKIKYYKIDDIDLDGNNEILIVAGYNDFEFVRIIVLRDVNGTIELINDNLKDSGYENYNADIIQLKDTNKKYINIKVTNGGNLNGFVLYDLTGNELNIIESSSSYTGTGNDELLDSDNDGKYDGFVQDRYSYDTLYYDIQFYYIWNGKEFIYNNMDIDLNEYPNDIKSVILEYMSLYYLYDGKNEQIYKRLNELSDVDIFNDGYIEISKLYSPIYNSLLEINEEIDFSIDEYEENTYVNITWKDEEENIYSYNLNLKQINGKWKIISSTHL